MVYNESSIGCSQEIDWKHPIANYEYIEIHSCIWQGRSVGASTLEAWGHPVADCVTVDGV